MGNPKIPNFGELLRGPLTSVPDEARVGLIARLERMAAARYREWADESPELAKGLLACAAREEAIADRAEALMPLRPEHEPAVDAVIDDAREQYAGVFEGYALRDRIVIQAHAERQGSLAWLGFASQASDEATKSAFLALADLEIESADFVDGALGITSTSEV